MATTQEELKKLLSNANNAGTAALFKRNRLGANQQRRQGGAGNTAAAFTANPTGTQTAGTNISPNIQEPTGQAFATPLGTQTNSPDGNTVSFNTPQGGIGSVTAPGAVQRLGGGGTVSSFDSAALTAGAQARTDLEETRAARAAGFSSVQAFRDEFSGANARSQQAKIDANLQRLSNIRAGREARTDLNRNISDVQDQLRRGQIGGQTASTLIAQLTKADNAAQAGRLEDNRAIDTRLGQAAATDVAAGAAQAKQAVEIQREQSRTVAQRAKEARDQANRDRAFGLNQQKQESAEAKTTRAQEQTRKKAVADILDPNKGTVDANSISRAVNVGGISNVIQSIPAAMDAINEARQLRSQGGGREVTAALIEKLEDIGFNRNQLPSFTQ